MPISQNAENGDGNFWNLLQYGDWHQILYFKLYLKYDTMYNYILKTLWWVLIGKVCPGTGTCGLSGLQMTFFVSKIGLDIGRVSFAKCLIFDEISFSLPIGCQKVHNLCIPIYTIKSTDWFKKGSLKNKWFTMLQFCVLSGLAIIWWWSKLRRGRTSVPNSNLSTPGAFFL